MDRLFFFLSVVAEPGVPAVVALAGVSGVDSAALPLLGVVGPASLFAGVLSVASPVVVVGPFVVDGTVAVVSGLMFSLVAGVVAGAAAGALSPEVVDSEVGAGAVALVEAVIVGAGSPASCVLCTFEASSDST